MHEFFTCNAAQKSSHDSDLVGSIVGLPNHFSTHHIRLEMPLSLSSSETNLILYGTTVT